jgi:hypothetical protein
MEENKIIKYSYFDENNKEIQYFIGSEIASLLGYKNTTQSKTKNLCGIYGIGLKENNFGLIDKKRHNKLVAEYDVDTNELINKYDSIYSCANILKIPFSTFNNYLTKQTVINGKYYKLL